MTIFFKKVLDFILVWDDYIFDKIICVKTPLKIIHERISNRENYSKNRVDKILDSQLSQDVKCSMSDFCIENTSKEKLLLEINRIHSLLL